MSIDQQRQVEVEQYRKEYQSPEYKMGVRRVHDVGLILQKISTRYDGNPGSLLDVSTGRGETLELAFLWGFKPIHGTEAVPELCDGVKVSHALIHALPFKDGAFDFVTCFDVMEHLIPEDTEAALRELYRVAGKAVIVSASSEPSVYNGRELHINKRPADEWDAVIKSVMPNATRYGNAGRSPCWMAVK